MNIKAFIIHLERATARKPIVADLIAALPIPAEVFPALDGAALDHDTLYANVTRISHVRPHYPFELSKGEIACYKSHRAIWQKIVDEDLDAGLVFEDDAVVNPSTFGPAFELAKAHIEEMGVIQLQTRPLAKNAEVLVENAFCKIRQPEVVQLRLTATLISKIAACRLLAATKTIDRPVDSFMQLTNVTGQPIAVVEPSGISEVSNDVGGTTIQQRKKSTAERIFREFHRVRYRWAVRRASIGRPSTLRLKNTNYHVQAILIRGFLAATKVLPLPLRAALAGHLTNAAIHLVPSLRRRAADNLHRVFPDMDPVQRRQILGQVARNTGRTLTEILFNHEFAAQAEATPIKGPGLEALSEARAKGKGAIIVSGHFGQWEAIRHALKAQDLETGALYRPNNNPYYEPLFRRGIKAGGAPIIARGSVGNRNMIKHVRSGGFIALLMDQYIQDGTTLTFMGHPAVTSLSAAQMALRYDLPLVPIFSKRTRDGFEIVAEEPIPHTHAREMMQTFNDRLGEQVRAEPGQWHWLHNRWKIGRWNDPTPSHEA